MGAGKESFSRQGEAQAARAAMVEGRTRRHRWN